MPTRPYLSDWTTAYESRFGVRMQWFGRYAGYPEWSILPSRLAADKICFFYVETGGCWIRVNGVHHELEAGELLVIRGGEEFVGGQNPERPHVSLSAALAIEQEGAANSLLHFDFQRRYRLREPGRYVREFERVLGLFKRHRSTREIPAVPPALKPQYESLPHRDILVTGALLRWVSSLVEILRPSVAPDALEPVAPIERVLAAETWAIANLSREFTLPEWAHAAGVHPDYLGRLFRKHTGKRPMEWLNERRLREVEQLLTSTSKPLAEIAEACGFGCPFYLSRVFKRSFGEPPGRYRKMRRQAKPPR
ncbi:MAG: hypothetical protein RLZZ142_1924 [Verrucomicrobiota bacterium]